MSRKILQSRSAVLIISAVSAVVFTRLLLFAFPGAGGSPLLGVHIHHLLFGILLACIGGIPAILLQSDRRLKSLATAVFGFGIGLSLDEWVLFVIRESEPDAPYMTPWSVIGAAFLIGLLAVYTLVVSSFATAKKQP